MALPDFLIVGAMKCGTSTLQAQLAAQPGVFMTTPKEPNFFSDDEIYARGLGWYEGLFAAAPAGALKGEASTHYTKLPTHPDCLDRLSKVVQAPKLVYMVRNPITRAVSHYIHEWTMGAMQGDIGEAFRQHPELVAYSRYAMQISPYAERFGAENILLVSLEAMRADPQGELERVGTFIGLDRPPVWQAEQSQMNASAERIRRIPLYDVLIGNQVAGALRRVLVPRRLRDAIKQRLQMRDRPELPDNVIRQLEATFIEDYARLRALFPDQEGISASYPFVAQ